MLWIGLTGGIACGKSTVSKLLRHHGISVIDADDLAREVVAKGTVGHAEVLRAFGPGSVSEDGHLDRQKIGALVFSDRNQLDLLEAIIHPRVRQRTAELKQQLEERKTKLAFYDVPLLFEKKMQALFDRTVVVSCSPETQLARLMSRNQLTAAEAQKRIAAQLPLHEKDRLATDRISNNGSIPELEKAVQDYLHSLRSLL